LKKKKKKKKKMKKKMKMKKKKKKKKLRVGVSLLHRSYDPNPVQRDSLTEARKCLLVVDRNLHAANIERDQELLSLFLVSKAIGFYWKTKLSF